MSDQPDTRERLLRAAIDVLAQDGERAIRVRDIAAQAGVTEPSLYHFFGSREGLIAAAQATRFREGQLEGMWRFADAVRDARSVDDFIAAVRNSLSWAYLPERRQARSTRIDVLGSAQSRPALAAELAAAQREVNEVMADIIEAAQLRGWARTDVNPRVLAAWIMGQITGRVFIEIDPELADSTEWNDISIDAVLTAFGHPPSPTAD